MKKFIFFVCIFIIGIILFFTFTNKQSDELRIRILSNGSTEIDLYEKQIVKDALEEVLNEIDSLNVVLIEKELKIKTEGKIKNEIKVERVNSYYPAKSYNNEFIPSGSYETILVTIGKGEGSNFWTLLYPEYYHIEFEEENEIEYRFFIFDFIKKFLT